MNIFIALATDQLVENCELFVFLFKFNYPFLKLLREFPWISILLLTSFHFACYWTWPPNITWFMNKFHLMYWLKKLKKCVIPNPFIMEIIIFFTSIDITSTKCFYHSKVDNNTKLIHITKCNIIWCPPYGTHQRL